jgi:hypothetical protein
MNLVLLLLEILLDLRGQSVIMMNNFVSHLEPLVKLFILGVHQLVLLADVFFAQIEVQRLALLANLQISTILLVLNLLLHNNIELRIHYRYLHIIGQVLLVFLLFFKVVKLLPMLLLLHLNLASLAI